jgi:hypothetical protein
MPRTAATNARGRRGGSPDGLCEVSITDNHKAARQGRFLKDRFADEHSLTRAG